MVILSLLLLSLLHYAFTCPTSLSVSTFQKHHVLKCICTAIGPDVDWTCFDWNKFQSSLVMSTLWFCNTNQDNEMWASPWLFQVIIIRWFIHFKHSCAACCCCIGSFAWYSKGRCWGESAWDGRGSGKVCHYCEWNRVGGIYCSLRASRRHGLTAIPPAIKKSGSYFLSRDWAGLRWHPVLKEREQLQDKHSKSCKVL